MSMRWTEKYNLSSSEYAWKFSDNSRRPLSRFWAVSICLSHPPWTYLWISTTEKPRWLRILTYSPYCWLSLQQQHTTLFLQLIYRSVWPKTACSKSLPQPRHKKTTGSNPSPQWLQKKIVPGNEMLGVPLSCVWLGSFQLERVGEIGRPLSSHLVSQVLARVIVRAALTPWCCQDE